MKPSAKNPNQASQRQLRVGEEIRHALAEALYDSGFVAHELEGISITVAQVKMSPDLRHAHAYVTPLGQSGEAAEKVVKALNKHAGYFRHEVDRRVALKFSAALKFVYDASFETAARLEDLLRQTGESSDTEE